MSIFRKPSDKSYSLSRGEAGVQLEGFDDAIHIGDFENMTLKPDFQEIERYSKNYAVKTLARKDTISRGGSIDMTVLQRLPEVRQMIFMGLEKKLGQAAAGGTKKTFATVRPGGIVSLGARDVRVTAVKAGAQDLASGKWKLDPRTGLLQIFDGGSAVEVTFDQLAVDRAKIGGFSTTNLYGRMWFRGLDAVNDEPLFINVHRLQFKVSSDVPLVGGDDYDQLQISGAMLPDLTQEDPDDQLFTVETIPAGLPDFTNFAAS